MWSPPQQAGLLGTPIDAIVLARLYASGFLPEVWEPDQRTPARRRQVTRRNQIVRQRARLKTIIQSILHAHLVPPCPHADLLGPKGRTWLLGQALPPDEQDAVTRAPARARPPRRGPPGRRAGTRARRARRRGHEAADDHPGHRHGRRHGAAGGDRSGRALRRLRQAGRLSRPEPERAPVWRRPASLRADHQAGPHSRADHAGGSSLAGGPRAGAAAGLLRTHRPASRQPHRRRRPFDAAFAASIR